MTVKLRKRILLVLLPVLIASFAALIGINFTAHATEDHSSHIALTTAYLREHGNTLESGNYYLPDNITITDTITISGEDVSVSLCLNGKSITFSGNSSERIPVITVTGGSSFAVSDCSSDESGKIDGANLSGSVIYLKESSFTLTSGSITGGRGTLVFDPYQNSAAYDGYDGYGYGEEGFYIHGGGIYAQDSSIEITGGAVYGNGVAAATAIYYGEDVTKYERENIGTEARPVYEGAIVEGGNHITYHSGDEVPISRAQGGGIFIGTSYAKAVEGFKSSFVMSGGYISNNVSALHGAGIFVHNVDFKMNGGVIGGSKAFISSYNNSGTTINFTDGGNYAFAGLTVSGVIGGGLYVYRGMDREHGNNLDISGTAEISYNYAYSGNSALYCTTDTTVNISGNVSISHNKSESGAAVNFDKSQVTIAGGIFEYNNGGSVLTASTGTDPLNGFKLTGGIFRYNTTGSYGTPTENGVSGGNLITVTGDAGVSVVVSGISVTNNTLHGGDYALYITKGLVTVQNVDVSNNIGKGYYSSGVITNGGAGMYVGSADTLSIKNTTVTNNVANRRYSGLTLAGLAGNTAVYELENVTVSGNTSTGYINASGTKTDGTYSGLNITAVGGNYKFTDVTVSNNYAYGVGSGLYVLSTTSDNGTKLDLNNVYLENNTSYSGSGGGLYLGYNVTATMTGGSVTGNSVGYYGEYVEYGSDGEWTVGKSTIGGGVYLNAANTKYPGAVLVADGVSITNNSATGSGGGVYVGSGAVVTGATEATAGASFTLTNGSITGNKATGYVNLSSGRYVISGGTGGGVCLDGRITSSLNVYGSFAMTGGSVSGNIAASSGGGIYTAGKVTLTGGVKVENNVAGTYGYGKVIASGADESGDKNYAGISGTGGGIYVGSTSSAALEMTGGSVSGNTATANGAGICVSASVASPSGTKLKLSLTGVDIIGNDNTSGYLTYGTADGGKITIANSTGGGLYIYNSANCGLDLTLSDLNVSYNKTRANGGGIWLSLYDGEYSASGLTVTNNVSGIYGDEENAGISGSGGGIYLSGTNYSFKLNKSSTTGNGSEISDNSATANGGGVYATVTKLANATTEYNDVYFDGAKVEGNLATGYYYLSNGQMVFNYGAGGGLYLNATTALPVYTLDGCSVAGNYANLTGGGIHVVNGSSTTVLKSTSVTGNIANGNGGGVCLANNNANLIFTVLSGTKISGNKSNNSTGTHNLYIPSGLKIYVSVDIEEGITETLSDTAEIYFYLNANVNANTSVVIAETSADNLTYSDIFKSDRANYAVEYTNDGQIIVKYDTSYTKPDDPAVQEPTGPEENPAKTIYIGVSVTDVNGNSSNGGTVVGDASVYWDGTSTEPIALEYTVRIAEGYYFSSITVNGLRYYYNSTDNTLYVYDGSSAVRADASSPIAVNEGIITVTLTVLTGEDDENSIILHVREIGAPYSISNATFSYDGSEKKVDKQFVNASNITRESSLLTFISNANVYYMSAKTGVWDQSAPVEVGTYQLRVQWDSNPFVGSTYYSGENWQLVINAQTWSESTTNVTVQLLDKDNNQLTVDSITYDGSASYAPDSVVVTDTNLTKVLVEGTDYVVSYSGNSGAGTATVTITGIGNYTGALNKTFVINQGTPTWSFVSDGEYEATFDNSNQTKAIASVQSDFAVSYELEGDATVQNASGTYSLIFLNAGVYKVTFSIGDGINYKVVTETVTVTVRPAENAVNYSDFVTVYTYNGGEQSISLANISLTYGTKVYSVSGNTARVVGGYLYFTNAGAYTLTVSSSELASSNYAFATVTIPITVNKLIIDKPVGDSRTFVYNGQSQTYSIPASGDYSATGIMSKTDAGSSYIYVSLKDTTNTVWSDGTSGTLSFIFNIEKANPTYAVPVLDNVDEGTLLSDIALPAGWAWVNPSASVTATDSSYQAVYTPEDTNNYNTVTVSLGISVIKAPTQFSETLVLSFAAVDAALIIIVIIASAVSASKKRRKGV